MDPEITFILGSGERYITTLLSIGTGNTSDIIDGPIPKLHMGLQMLQYGMISRERWWKANGHKTQHFVLCRMVSSEKTLRYPLQLEIRT